jgi:hypothetical protein
VSFLAVEIVPLKSIACFNLIYRICSLYYELQIHWTCLHVLSNPRIQAIEIVDAPDSVLSYPSVIHQPNIPDKHFCHLLFSEMNKCSAAGLPATFEVITVVSLMTGVFMKRMLRYFRRYFLTFQRTLMSSSSGSGTLIIFLPRR